jgi:hypothetical protein
MTNTWKPMISDSAALDNSSNATRCDGVVWFGNVDWWYHNSGHASIRMATRISRRVPTVWINSIGMRLPIPGRTEIAWRRYTRKLKSLFKGLRCDPDAGMWIYSPVFVPYYSPQMIEINGVLAQRIQSAMQPYEAQGVPRIELPCRRHETPGFRALLRFDLHGRDA